MPRLEQCHEQVVRALEKRGWHVDDQPQRLINEYNFYRWIASASGDIRRTLI